MGSWREFERDEFIADQDKRQKRADVSKIQQALSELGISIKDVGVDFVAETVESMQPKRFEERYGWPRQTEDQDLTEAIAAKLVERALGLDE